MKPVFIAFSDIQIEDWTRYSENHERLFHNEIALKKVYQLCKKYKCPALFCGDMFDNPNSLKNYVLNHVFKWFNRFRDAGIKIYCISGNHDQCEKNTLDHTSPNYIIMLSTIYDNVINLDLKSIEHGGICIHGIPYMYDDASLMEAIKMASKKIQGHRKNILMLHTHLPGVKEPNGFEVETTLSKLIYRDLKKFDLVISGHIHKPQPVFANTTNLGATHNQRISDAGCEMGIWKIYDDIDFGFQLGFIPLNIPQFRYYEEDKKPDDDFNMLIPIPNSDDEDEGEDVKLNFNAKLKPRDLVDNYFKVKDIKSRSKKEILLKYLNI